jgi:hypothetical protein
MTTEILKQITEISNELKNLHGNDYGEQFCNRALFLITNNSTYKSDYQIIFEAVHTLIDNNYKDRLIFNLQKKIKEQEARITKLEEDNKQKDTRITKLEEDNKQKDIKINKLEKQVNVLMRNQYYIILSEVIKNIEYYIIQSTTRYDNNKMKNIDLNLNEFINNPENAQYKLEIEKLMEKFEISKYNASITKIINKRNRISHPNPVEMEELQDACNELKKIYPGIDELYNHYQEVYDYFNV